MVPFNGVTVIHQREYRLPVEIESTPKPKEVQQERTEDLETRIMARVEERLRDLASDRNTGAKCGSVKA